MGEEWRRSRKVKKNRTEMIEDANFTGIHNFLRTGGGGREIVI